MTHPCPILPADQLSKVLQQWRIIVAQNAGLKVSANITPAARTLSVTHSAQAAAGIEGATTSTLNSRICIDRFLATSPQTPSNVLCLVL